MNTKVNRMQENEFLGQIIDTFEDFLQEKGIQIPNDERTGEDGEAIIYGTDYGDLEDELRTMMQNWDIFEKPDRNTRMSYLYRDADNYKVHSEYVISGHITEEQVDEIIGCLDEGGYFIPSQVGLPENRFDAVTDRDHPWFELDRTDFRYTDRKADLDITVEELVAKFRKARGNWDESILLQ